MGLRIILFSIYTAVILFCGTTFVKAQTMSNLCFPLGVLATQAAKHGEYPAFSFRDIQYMVNFTLHINPKSGSYTLVGVADMNPEIECVASVGTDFKPVIDKSKGMPL
tara:strand:+ start:715 stop:1038 length:324 start_codon:yes stop_codon:yes gene_type:complete